MTSVKYQKQGPVHPPLWGGREQKEERKRGGGGRVGKESLHTLVSVCVKGGGVRVILNMVREAWAHACVGFFVLSVLVGCTWR